MMAKEYINPGSLFNSQQYGFSQVVTSQGGKTIYLSGQVAWDENQQIVGPGDFRAQVWRTFRNIELALKATGAGLEDVVSMRIYILTEKVKDTHPVSVALKTFFPGGHLPATTWIGVQSLANEDFLIEIEVIAVKDDVV
jgi:enamine deaminase RidA (YjgF/YER057c/UK114 family)